MNMNSPSEAKTQGIVSEAKQTDLKAAYAVVVIWFVLVGFVAMAAYFTSASSFAVAFVREHKLFHMALCLPGVIVLFVWSLQIVLALSRPDKSLVVKSSMLYVLIGYLVYVIALTGGIMASPLTPVGVIVPLLAGPFIQDSSRARLLIVLLIGMLGVGVASGTIAQILPPKQYPPNCGWSYTGVADWIITTLGICGSLGIEALLIKFKLARP